MNNKITCWEEVIADDIQRMDLSCKHCHHINILIKGENLNCENCGERLLEFVKSEQTEVKE